MTVSPRSPSPSLAPGGTVRASLVSVIEKIYRRWRPGHESPFGQTGPLCDLYPCLHRAWPRPGVQLAGRAIRGRLGLYQKPGPRGWTLIRSRYDDGGYSGGSTNRPDLQKMLNDIRSRKIDVIVVYKVDRLTRSLADFAKLVELFDAHGVSFVSVTQQFNTTTSMGRLTLNVLLSFAQFEREVTSERIRDKIGASKRRGLWVGGMVPLGYVSRDKKLFIDEEEAERVRTIFQRYLDLGSIGLLLVDLRERGVVTKVRQLSDGRTVGGIPFTRGPLAYLLRNRLYISQVVFKGQICPGAHPLILHRDLFEAVQRRLAEPHNGYRAPSPNPEAPLIGRI